MLTMAVKTRDYCAGNENCKARNILPLREKNSNPQSQTPPV